MERLPLLPVVSCLMVVCLCSYTLHTVSGATVGVAYGRVGNNLPAPGQVVSLLQQNGVEKVRIYDADNGVLDAFMGSGMKLIVGTLNEDLAEMAASDGAKASSWVNSNIIPHASSIDLIVVGNEILTMHPELSQYVHPAMVNIHNALQAAGSNILVSTAHAFNVVGGYPPSTGTFTSSVQQYMGPILDFLSQTGAPFVAHVYPFFAYMDNTDQIKLEYALFQTNDGIDDSGNGLHYSNLFDAQVDTLIAAMEKMGHGDIPLVVAESGWPHEGATPATLQNAQAYNSNMAAHVPQGTPRRPNALVSTYVFSLFDENQKPGAAYEQHFGVFNPVSQMKFYDFNF